MPSGGSRPTNDRKAARDRGQVAPVVQVVGLDVGDHGHGGGQLEERAVGLVGLGHEMGAAAGGGVDPAGLEVAADGERRVEPGRLQDGHDHAGGGGLAVGAGDRDAVLALHEQGQQLGPAEHGDVQDPGRDQLRVGGPDRGRGDHQVGPPHPGPVVARPDLGPEGPQRLEGGRLAPVRPGDPVPPGQQQPGEPAHPGPTDPDQVDSPRGPVPPAARPATGVPPDRPRPAHGPASWSFGWPPRASGARPGRPFEDASPAPPGPGPLVRASSGSENRSLAGAAADAEGEPAVPRCSAGGWWAFRSIGG